jgi:hypothetical protein
MVTRKQTRGYSGVSALRKKLRETPALVEQYVRPAMDNAAQAVKIDMISLIPELTGNLQNRVSYKLSPDGMAALIGPEADRFDVVARYRKKYGVLGVSSEGKVATVATQAKVADIASVFYFRFLDSGTKGAPDRNIPPQPALNIRQRALDANSSYAKNQVAIAVKKALNAAANIQGSSDNG